MELSRASPRGRLRSRRVPPHPLWHRLEDATTCPPLTVERNAPEVSERERHTGLRHEWNVLTLGRRIKWPLTRRTTGTTTGTERRIHRTARDALTEPCGRRAAAGYTAVLQRAEFASPLQRKVFCKCLTLAEGVEPRLIDVTDFMQKHMIEVVPPDFLGLPNQSPLTSIRAPTVTPRSHVTHRAFGRTL